MRCKVMAGKGMVLGVKTLRVNADSNTVQLEIDMSHASVRLADGVAEVSLPFLPEGQVTDMDYSNAVPILTVRSEEVQASAPK